MEHKTSYKSITVILDKDGTAVKLAQKLKDDADLLTGNIQSARGSSTASAAGRFSHQIEKDILTVICPEYRADEIFGFIYTECKIGDRHGGFMFQTSLGIASDFSLPETPV